MREDQEEGRQGQRRNGQHVLLQQRKHGGCGHGQEPDADEGSVTAVAIWKPAQKHCNRNGHEEDGLFVDLEGEEEEGQRRVDQGKDEVGLGRLQEEEEVGGERGEEGWGQACHGQGLNFVKFFDLHHHVDGAPDVGNLVKRALLKNSFFRNS